MRKGMNFQLFLNDRVWLFSNERTKIHLAIITKLSFRACQEENGPCSSNLYELLCLFESTQFLLPWGVVLRPIKKSLVEPLSESLTNTLRGQAHFEFENSFQVCARLTFLVGLRVKRGFLASALSSRKLVFFVLKRMVLRILGHLECKIKWKIWTVMHGESVLR